MIKVLVVEDSLTMQSMLVEILSSDPGIKVVGTANNGKEAISQANALKPDVITMDIRMPIMDGFEATRRIMHECPTRIIVVSASIDSPDLNISFNAIKAGALEIVEKPRGNAENFESIRERLVNLVKVMSEVKVVRRRAHAAPSAAGSSSTMPALGAAGPARALSGIIPAVKDPSTQPLPHPANVSGMRPASATGIFSRVSTPAILAIGSSTGGPAALSVMFKGLPKTLPVPVVVVQHISKGFTRGLVDWLQTECALPIKIAQQDERIFPGEIYFAPDNQHLVLHRRGLLGLTQSAPVSFVRPSVTVLFESVAKHYSNQAIAVILTGMGDDGATGIRTIRDAGGTTLGQDEASCVVYGMPKAAAELGGLSHVVPLPDIASRVVALCQRETPAR
jgi:two-component system chemotaxis response regulator CheB